MIEIKNLTKMYGKHLAVQNLNLTIETGHIYGFLGPNGAGKSTTMNMITGCLAATEGTVVINGHDIFEEPVEAKKNIGYLPELPPLYTDMTPYEYLTFVGEAKGIRRSEVHYQVEYVIEETRLKDVEDRLIENLSKGYRQRVGIAQAMLGDPEIIILDEPTVGLDPKQKNEILELIRSLAQDHTVILSSHVLSEIQAVCDYIIIISKGKIVAADTPENLSRQIAGTYMISLVVAGDIEEIRRFAAGLDFAVSVTISDNPENSETYCLVIETDGTDDRRPAVYQHIRQTALTLYDMTNNMPGLETVYMRLTEEDETETNMDAAEAAVAGTNETEDEFNEFFDSETTASVTEQKNSSADEKPHHANENDTAEKTDAADETETGTGR